MAVLGLLVVVVFPLQTLLLLVVQAARALERHQEPLAAQAVRPALRALLALRLLLEICSGKVVAVAVVVLLARAVQAVLEAVALVAAVAVLRAVHTLLAPVVSAVMAGH